MKLQFSLIWPKNRTVNIKAITSRIMKVLILALLLGTAKGYNIYHTEIPNGDKVPNPCTDNFASKWKGVGHKNVGGGGDLNIFGKDFFQAGKVGQ